MDVLGYFGSVVSSGLVGFALALRADFKVRVVLACLGLLGAIAGAYLTLGL